MVNYRAPGVYVEEVPSGARSISQVGTSSAGFVGIAPHPDAPLNTVETIDNWSSFVQKFVRDSTTGTHLATAVYGFFANGGSRCYVVNIGPEGSLLGTASQPGGLVLLEAIDDVAIVAAPGFADPESYDALISHCEHPLRQDRVAILDTKPAVQDVGHLLEVGTSKPVKPAKPAGGAGDGAGAPSDEDTPDGPEGPMRPPNSADGYATLYYPWVATLDPVTGQTVYAPPSGHVAGLWARIDATRGVHKAPANARLAGVTGLAANVSRGDQELLNPAGINCIRYFTGEGILVWGARTLAPADSPFRYIGTRRFTNMLKESILESTRWAVFEPNSQTLWNSLTRDVRAFLMNVWRDGALFGRTPDQAFFVKCDEETNPPEVRDEGKVVMQIGVAIVKPAEFVVFQLMQSANAAEAQS